MATSAGGAELASRSSDPRPEGDHPASHPFRSSPDSLPDTRRSAASLDSDFVDPITQMANAGSDDAGERVNEEDAAMKDTGDADDDVASDFEDLFGDDTTQDEHTFQRVVQDIVNRILLLDTIIIERLEACTKADLERADALRTTIDVADVSDMDTTVWPYLTRARALRMFGIDEEALQTDSDQDSTGGTDIGSTLAARIDDWAHGRIGLAEFPSLETVTSLAAEPLQRLWNMRALVMALSPSPDLVRQVHPDRDWAYHSPTNVQTMSVHLNLSKGGRPQVQAALTLLAVRLKHDRRIPSVPQMGLDAIGGIVQALAPVTVGYSFQHRNRLSEPVRRECFARETEFEQFVGIQERNSECPPK